MPSRIRPNASSADLSDGARVIGLVEEHIVDLTAGDERLNLQGLVAFRHRGGDVIRIDHYIVPR